MKLPLMWAFVATMAAPPVLAAIPTTAPASTAPLVTGVVNDQERTILSGNHAAATAVATDRGAVAGAHVFQHVKLQLKRSPAMQAAFDRLVADQQTSGNPNFHHWLSSADLRRFGPAQSDIDRVTAWLRTKGVTVSAQSSSGMTLDIGGRAGALAAAFGTELHVYQLRGETHFANTRDVSIPSALRPVVDGVTLSNFFPRPNMVRKANFTIPVGKGKLPFYAVAPSDFARIYNVVPMLSGDNAYGKAMSGTGVTVAVLEDSDMLPRDWETFRQAFAIDVPDNGYGSYHGHLISLHPGGCTPPGRNGDEGEAALDTEWASAAAPDANVVEASCVTTETTFGVATALAALVEGKQTDATIYSISFGGCEQENGLAFLSLWSNLTEEAAAEGISVVVSSGDSGSSCDRSIVDSNGIGVNGLAANPYVVSVGGTDFSDAVMGKTGQYWNRTNNLDNLYSARSYVPEVPWDDSCANSIIAKLFGYASPAAACNAFPAPGASGVGASGGPSLFYAKPAWQAKALLGMPNDGVRDQPDVVSFAANGALDHASLMCFSDKNTGGYPCVYHGTSVYTGGPAAETQLVGGTSVAAPAFAGILALLTEVQQQKLGNPAPRLYELAAMQYSNPVLVKSCNASLGFNISSGCIFNNVTQGDIAQPCGAATLDCHIAEATQGVGFLSAEGGHSTKPAFLAAPGYSMAAGLGSVNTTNLIYNY